MKLYAIAMALSACFWLPEAPAQDPEPPAEKPRVVDEKLADEDFRYQGEYQGEWQAGESSARMGIQVVAMGDGTFQAYTFLGGLPGDGWNGQQRIAFPSPGVRGDDGVRFEDPNQGTLWIRPSGGMTVTDPSGRSTFRLHRIVRKSKTLGARPPREAVVLFDGSSVEGWVKGRRSDDGLLLPGTTSERTFGDHKLHIEFLLPYMPADRGQGRGNSGVYVQGRYEVQMLDSFGLDGKQNECGGLYSIKAPDLNMCFPPLSWQTYDIEFTAARFENGEPVAPATMTVFHNGVKIHDRVELPPRKTTAAPMEFGSEPGPIYLQDHGCPVRYRNIWVVDSATH